MNRSLWLLPVIPRRLSVHAGAVYFYQSKMATVGRPRKNNANWFPHDTGMRNHRKIKMLRANFGLEGYAVYNMMIEFLADQEFARLVISEDEFDLLSLDFGFPKPKLKELVDFCIQKGLFSINNVGVLTSQGLQERLQALYSKRSKGRSESETPISESEISISESETRISDVGKSHNRIDKSTVIIHTNIEAVPASVDSVVEFFRDHRKSITNPELEGAKFWNHYRGTGWINGSGQPIENWKAVAANWKQKGK